MGVVDNFLKKMKMVNEEDEYDDYDDYDDYEDDEEILPKKKPEKQKKTRVKERARDLDDDDLDDYDDFEEKVTAPQKPAPKKATYTQSSYAGSSSSYSQQRQNVVGMNRAAGAGPEVCMIMPKSFDDANTIAELLLERKAVVLNLEGIDMSAAVNLFFFQCVMQGKIPFSTEMSPNINNQYFASKIGTEYQPQPTEEKEKK